MSDAKRGSEIQYVKFKQISPVFCAKWILYKTESPTVVIIIGLVKCLNKEEKKTKFVNKYNQIEKHIVYLPTYEFRVYKRTLRSKRFNYERIGPSTLVSERQAKYILDNLNNIKLIHKWIRNMMINGRYLKGELSAWQNTVCNLELFWEALNQSQRD